MRRLLLLPCLLAAAACDPAVSRTPLVTAGGEQPLPGLWALMESGCAQPRDGAVQSWPKCATPVWIQPGEATVIMGTPVTSRIVVSAGEPRILQFTTETEAGETRFGYYVLQTAGPPPHRSAQLWPVFCEAERGSAASADAPDEECLVEDPRELLRLARASAGEDLRARAAYIGPR